MVNSLFSSSLHFPQKVPLANQAHVLQYFLQPQFLGDLFFKDIMMYPDYYGIPLSVTKAVLTAFFQRLWNDGDVIYDVQQVSSLTYVLPPDAILSVDIIPADQQQGLVDCSILKPQLSNIINSNRVFLIHNSIRMEQRTKIPPVFIRRLPYSSYTLLTPDLYLQQMNNLSDTILNVQRTKGFLAGKPFFNVTLTVLNQGDDFVETVILMAIVGGIICGFVVCTLVIYSQHVESVKHREKLKLAEVERKKQEREALEQQKKHQTQVPSSFGYEVSSGIQNSSTINLERTTTNQLVLLDDFSSKVEIEDLQKFNNA